MKIILIVAFLLSFAEPRTYKFEFTEQEVGIIYDALGKLPAEQVEGVRFKIRSEVNKQLKDTTKK